jgi:hypothetical protein
MHLESSIYVRRSPEAVSAYLGNLSNIAEWDQGVSRTEAISDAQPRVGFEFNTIAHPRGRSHDGSWGKMPAISNPPNGASVSKPNPAAAGFFAQQCSRSNGSI